jgi:hypothetical protein
MFRKCPLCTDSDLYHELAFPSPKSALAPPLREQTVFQVAEGGRDPCPRRAILCKLSQHPYLFGRTAMRAFLVACVFAIVVAAVGAVVLNHVQEPVQQAFATTGVRL